MTEIRTEIEMRHLSPIVRIDQTSSVYDIVRGLRDIDETVRRDSVVVVDMPDGTFETFTYQDLLESLAADESISGLPMLDVLPRVGAVESIAIDRAGYGIGDANDLRVEAPGNRLVVLENAFPVGVLIDQALGGGGEAVQRLEDRMFQPQAAMGDGPRAEPAEAGATPRWLSAKVSAGGEQRRRSFQAGSVNVVEVGIAPSDLDLIQSDEPFPVQPPPEGESYRMDVVVSAPDLLEKPLRGQFDLPHEGPSVEPAKFEIELSAAVEHVALDIQVLFKNRTVQLATLVGAAVAGADLEEGAPIELQRTAATGIDPAVARPFDAALVLTGENLVVHVGEKSAEFAFAGIKEAAKTIQDRLYASQVQAAHEGAEGANGATGVAGAKSGATIQLLTMLAFQGRAIYEVLVGERPELAAARTLEVTLRDAGAFLPIEFAYERPVPGDDPALCPNWAEAFEQGAVECPDCPAKAADSAYICPLGFWGLSREIARRIDPTITNEEARSAAPSNPSSATPRLARLTGAVIGASQRVDAAGEATSQIGATVDVAAELFGMDKVSRVEDWAAWVTAVKERVPSLLLAMPHTEMDDAVAAEVLQIGAASNLRSLNIRGDHVQAPVGLVGPIVLLLGCTTAKPEIGYLGFVPRFLTNHAAVVVGTVAKVLGRQTGPVARQFMRAAVAAQGKDVTLGEVMRRIRGDMLREGNLMGMTLTAYGNSDWLLAAP